MKRPAFDWSTILVWTFIGIELLCIVIFQFHISNWMFNSDAAGFNIYLHEVVKTGSIFPETITYTLETVRLNLDILTLPFLPLLGNSLLTHSVGKVIALLLLLGSALFLGRVLDLGAFCLGVMLFIVLSGFNYQYSQMMFSQFNYSYFVVQANLVIALSVLVLRSVQEGNILSDRDARLRLILSTLAIYFLLILFVGPSKRMLANLTVPLLMSLSIICVLDRTFLKKGWLQVSLIFLVFFLGFQTSRGIVALTKDYLSFSGNRGVSLVADLAGMADLIKRTLYALEVFADGLRLRDLVHADFVSWVTMVSVSKILLLIVLIAGSFYIMCYVKTPWRRLIVLFWGLSVGGVLTAAIYFNRIIDGPSARYFVLQYFYIGVAFAVVLSVFLRQKSKYAQTKWRALALVLLCPLFVDVVNAYIAPGTHMEFKEGRFEFEVRRNEHNGIAKYLADKGHKVCYASFWHAQVVTVLTDFKVQVIPIYLDRIRRVEVGLDHWYDPSFHDGETCLLIHASEYSGNQLDRVRSFFGNEKSSREAHGYHVFTYDYNISAAMQGMKQP